ncbi:MAG: S8 family serine peptidase [Xanthomonadales bacterium]|nr:S8 family serine peptidase [Xanthomonadales bacterium]
MRMADGSWVGLQPLPLQLEAVAGTTVARLSGTPVAEMATARVMRAAQAFFELPSRAPTPAAAPVVASRSKASTRALGNVLERKTISAYLDADTRLMRILYKQIVLRFRAGTPQKLRNAIIRDSGLRLLAENPLAPGQVTLSDDAKLHPGEALVRLAAQLATLDEVAFATPDFISQYRRSLPAASGTPSTKQWHLKLIGATQAWKHGRGKRGVVVAVLDDGIDIEHPELRTNVLRHPDPDEARDLCGRDFYLADDDPDHFNPRPKRFRTPFEEMAGNDIHGTCCAGVAVGRGPKAYGLAPNCRLLPVKVFHADDLASDSRVADAIRYAAQFADVISCSWGGAKSPDIEFALRDARAIGRKGRGAVVVCASGNEERKQVDYPASDANAMAIGASTDGDDLAWYSNSGPQLCVVAPSNGGARGIFTTDVSTPGRGFNTGKVAAGGADGLFTNDFGGTSSATPLVAGLCALILSLKPEMTPDDVRAILIASAKKIGPASAYKANGHSNKFGHGRIDAAKAVALAKAWKPPAD